MFQCNLSITNKSPRFDKKFKQYLNRICQCDIRFCTPRRGLFWYEIYQWSIMVVFALELRFYWSYVLNVTKGKEIFLKLDTAFRHWFLSSDWYRMIFYPPSKGITLRHHTFSTNYYCSPVFLAMTLPVRSYLQNSLTLNVSQYCDHEIIRLCSSLLLFISMHSISLLFMSLIFYFCMHFCAPKCILQSIT